MRYCFRLSLETEFRERRLEELDLKKYGQVSNSLVCSYAAATLMFGTRGAICVARGRLDYYQRDRARCQASCDTLRCFIHPIPLIVTHEPPRCL